MIKHQKNNPKVTLLRPPRRLLGAPRSSSELLGDSSEDFDFFDFVLCPEDLPDGWAKPSPLALLRVSELSDSKTNELLYIGDMLSAKHCSEGAGVKYIHCIYGYDPSVNAQNSISNFGEIIKFIK